MQATTTELGLLRSLCRDSYEDFVREFWETTSAERLRWNWHMSVICQEFQRAAERVFLNLPREHDLLVNISPGTSKSTLLSILSVPWVWTRMPHAQFIMPSYAYPLALELSNKCRDVVKSEKYKALFPEIQIRTDQDTKGFFKNTKGGYRYAIGAGGSVIGFHGHFIIIDDPLDPTQAASEAELVGTNHWIKQTLRGRKVEKPVTLTTLVMQRLHQNDPSAQMVARNKPGKPKRVRHLRIPAELTYKVEPPELAQYYVDGLMDPVRLPREVLDEERSPEGLGEYGYAGQYGQDPVPAGGGRFKTDRLKKGTPPPLEDPRAWKWLVRFWDKAASEGGGAYSVGVLMGEDRIGRIWVLDVVRRQWDTYKRERMIRRRAELDTRRVVVGVEQEGGSGGKESAEGTVRRLKGFRVRTISPKGDKDLRAEEFSVQVNGGNVWLPGRMHDGADWTGWAKEYVEELKHFPHSTFKDQVDASSGGLTVGTRKMRRVGGMKRRNRPR